MGGSNVSVIWKSRVEAVDIDTGEEISKAKALKEYIIIKRTKTYKVDGINGTITHRWQCERDRQQRLELRVNRKV